MGEGSLGKSRAALPADQENIAPFEEFERDEGERLRPLGADGGTGVIDKHEVASGQQCAIAIAGIGLVLRPGEYEHWPLHLAEGFIGQAIGRCEHEGTDSRPFKDSLTRPPIWLPSSAAAKLPV